MQVPISELNIYTVEYFLYNVCCWLACIEICLMCRCIVAAKRRPQEIIWNGCVDYVFFQIFWMAVGTSLKVNMLFSVCPSGQRAKVNKCFFFEWRMVDFLGNWINTLKWSELYLYLHDACLKCIYYSWSEMDSVYHLKHLYNVVYIP